MKELIHKIKEILKLGPTCTDVHVDSVSNRENAISRYIYEVDNIEKMISEYRNNKLKNNKKVDNETEVETSEDSGIDSSEYIGDTF